jgi:NTE family protein
MQRVTGWLDAARSLVGARPRRVRIGLALGGGFARGMAHIGVLRALEKNQIPIHAIAGVSSGSLVAAAYASGADAQFIENVALAMRLKDIARFTISRLGLAGSDRMIAFLGRLLKVSRFEDMKIPLAVVATDLNSGKAVVFRDRGDVHLPIRASCAYPGLFLPIQDQGRCLVDGFVSMEVPAEPLWRMGCTHVIAVNIPCPSDCKDFGHVFSVVRRCFQIMGAQAESQWRKQSSVIITPGVDELEWDSFASAKVMIERGQQAANLAMPAIRQWLQPVAEKQKAGAALSMKPPYLKQLPGQVI